MFRHFRERILSEGGSEALRATSFRTHVGLMRIVNVTFSTMLKDLHQDLQAHRERSPHEALHVPRKVLESG